MWRIAALALVLFGSSSARAQSPTAAEAADEAARLFHEGADLRSAGRYTEACDRFARSYVLDRTGGAELSLADCAERGGQLARAWELYDDAARTFDATGNVASASYARDKAAKLAPRLATIVVHLATPDAPGLTVAIGGRNSPPAAEIVRLDDARTVDIDVSAPGRQPFHRAVVATAGAKIVVDVPALGPPELLQPIPEVATRRRRSRAILAGTVGGVGVLSLGASLGYALYARHEYRSALDDAGCSGTSCPPRTTMALDAAYDEQETRMHRADALAIAGGALVAAGIILYVTAPREQFVVAPTASATGAGISLVGAF